MFIVFKEAGQNLILAGVYFVVFPFVYARVLVSVVRG